MNKDQRKGAARTAAGKAQRGAGKLVGSNEQQLKGAAREIAGKAQKRVGDAREGLETNRKEREKREKNQPKARAKTPKR